jgi:hypothetical protein
VTPKRPRRRLRVRRKRRIKRLASEFRDGAVNAAGNAATEATAENSVEVVGEFGGCVVEAVGGAAVLVALLTVPAILLIR